MPGKQAVIDTLKRFRHVYAMKDWPQACNTVIQNWAAALNRGDIPGVLSFYTDNAMLVPTMVGTFLETQHARAIYFEKLLAKQTKVRFDAEPPHEMICNDIAILSGDYEFFSSLNETSVHARFSFTFQQHDGEWKIIHHHSSQTPEKILLVSEPIR